MDNNVEWQFVQSPVTLDAHRDDYLNIVPPIPRANPNLSYTQTENRSHPHPHASQTIPIARPAHTHHLRPVNSHHSLRSHRSMSSVDSQMTGWSTIGDGSMSSETDLSASMTLGQGHGGQPSLSIDPRLFQRKSTIFNREDEEEEEEGGKTAVPKIKSPARKKGGQGVNEGKRKASHARKSQQHPEHIPRPRNAFILFRKHVVDSKLIPPSVEMRHQNVSIITAKMWSEAPPEQKAHFNEMAKIEKEEHLKKYPGYRYQPVYRRTNVIRRRVRKDEAEEEKCESVAKLLLKGTSGYALEHVIQEKGKVPSPPNEVAKRSKSTSRRGSAACELSKGALRALRAQARQGSTRASSEWSESHSRAQSVESDSLRPEFDMGQHQDGQQMDEEGMGMPYAPDTYCDAPMIYGHPGMGAWAFEEGVPPMGYQQSYAYPEDDAGGYNTVQQPQFTYPQPSQTGPSSSALGFYNYDQALPFSPTGANNFPHYDTSMYDSLAPHSLDNNNLAMGITSFLHPPMSARWDRHNLLPPSSEVPFEGLPFDDYDLMLNDFGSALAQADDMVAW